MNVPTVKLAMAFGMYQAINYAHEMGISTFVLEGDVNDNNYSTALGGLTRGVTPLELTNAYCTFANNGAFIPHIVITKVLDRNGNILEEAIPDPKQVIRPESAASLTSMLEDVIRRGTGKSANIGRPAAGKTGTTSDYHDAWFVGYTPDLVAGVWVGNDDNTPTDGIMGGGIPAMIWSHFMQNALLNTPVHDFDEMVVEQRGAPVGSSGGSQRDESYYSRQNESYDDGNYNSSGGENYSYDPQYQENNNPPAQQNEPSRTDYPDDTGYNPGYHDTPRNEPVEYQPPSEPLYEPPSEPIIYEPSTSTNDVPSPGDSDDKGRN